MRIITIPAITFICLVGAISLIVTPALAVPEFVRDVPVPPEVPPPIDDWVALPRRADSLFTDAVAALEADNAAKALDLVEQAIALDSETNPAERGYYGLRAECMNELGNQSGTAAVSFYNDALRSSRRGAIADARRFYDRALMEDPLMLWAANNRAWLAATRPDPEGRKDQDAAIYAMYACVKSDWRNWSFIDTLGAAFAESGDYDSAVRCTERALDIAPPEHRQELRNALAAYRTRQPRRVEDANEENRSEDDEKSQFAEADEFAGQHTVLPWLSPGTPEEVAFRQMVGVQCTDRLLPLVADPAAVKPIMEAYYSDARNRRPGYTAEQIEYIVIHPEDDPMADGVSFRVLTKERGDQSGLLGVTWVVRTPKRGYKIDWSKTHAQNKADGNRPLIAGAQRAKTTNDLMAKRESLPAKAVRREDYKSASLRQVVNDPLDFVGKRVYFKDMSVSPGVDRDRARNLGVLVVDGDGAVSGRFVQRGEFAVVADVDMCKKLDEPLRQSGRSNFTMQRIRAQMGAGGLGEQAPDPALEAKYPARVKRLWVSVIQSDDGDVLGCIDAIEVWTPFPTPQGTIELYQK